MRPKVSVIMPCYNAEKYIEDAINSILGQTFECFELIIIDDGSTDRSLSYAYALQEKDDRIKIIRNESNRGIGYSRNRGIRESRGEYIALMDTDDIAYSNRFKDQVTVLDENKEIDAVSGYYDIITQNGLVENQSELHEYSAKEVAIRLLFKCVIADSSAMCRKSVLVKNNIMFPENFRAVGAYKFWCEFALHGTIVVLKEKYYQYRINEEGLTQTTKRNNLQERYEWHNIIHDFYWNINGIVLSDSEKSVLFNATNGRHIDRLLQLFLLKRAIKQFYASYSENNIKTDNDCLKKVCRELMLDEIIAYGSNKYRKIMRKK